MLLVHKHQALALSVSSLAVETAGAVPIPRRCRHNIDHLGGTPQFNPVSTANATALIGEHREFPSFEMESISPATDAGIDPFYLFACHVAWEQQEDPSAGWELVAAAQSTNSETRAQARSLLAGSRHLGGMGLGTNSESSGIGKRQESVDTEMNAPYGMEILENCSECAATNPMFFCGFPRSILSALDNVSQRSILPAGAILYVEGQSPRGMFIICSGKVNLSTASREGKILLLKTAMPGETVGLSASVSGTGYETTAETATPCQLNFVERKHLLELMQSHSEVGVHAAQCLSRDFRSAHRDIHDLVLTRSSKGKLARLILAQFATQEEQRETHIHPVMTHEEMAQRIGASRETVTRLLSALRKKRLIRLDGASLTIRDRPGLETLAT